MGILERKKKEKGSHELVEMAYDGKTPKRIRDGQFVFIDEETCIGCTQVSFNWSHYFSNNECILLVLMIKHTFCLSSALKLLHQPSR